MNVMILLLLSLLLSPRYNNTIVPKTINVIEDVVRTMKAFRFFYSHIALRRNYVIPIQKSTSSPAPPRSCACICVCMRSSSRPGRLVITQ